MSQVLATGPLAMYFLMNEVVLSLDHIGFPRRMAAPKFKALSFNAVLRLGQELYAEFPLLHYDRPERALRLAALLTAKAPAINGALFVAPRFGCAPSEVSVRLANTSMEVMLELYSRQQAGRLDTVAADRQVWRRLAA